MSLRQNINIVNRRAGFDYEFIEKYTAGLVLLGTEIKSIRLGKVSMNDSYCHFQDGELFVKNLSISNMNSARIIIMKYAASVSY